MMMTVFLHPAAILPLVFLKAILLNAAKSFAAWNAGKIRLIADMDPALALIVNVK